MRRRSPRLLWWSHHVLPATRVRPHKAASWRYAVSDRPGLALTANERVLRRHGLTLLLSWSLAASLAFVVLLGLFRYLVFSDLFHQLAHRRLGTAQRFTRAAPMTVVQELQDYFRRDGLHLMAHPLFSYRERRHYQDIKALLQNTETALRWGLISILSLAMGLGCSARRFPQGIPRCAAMVMRRTALLLIGLVALCGLCTLDFEAYFVRMHHLVFDSRYWLLPPYAASVQLFPVEYFLDFFRAYTASVCGAAVLLWAAAWGTGKATFHRAL